MNKKFYQAGAALAVLTFAAQSFASPAFPNEVREAAGMACTPSCTLCHTVDPGVPRTATKPFAQAMQAAGLVALKPETVAPAYAELLATLDTDMDGVTDKAELEEQESLASDPNNPDSLPGNGPTICAGEVLYGCGAQIAQNKEPGQPWGAWSLLLAVGSGIVWTVRRRSLRVAHLESSTGND